MFGFKSRVWRTVAIDTSHGWTRKVNDEKVFEGQHIILFQICDRTGERRIIADDATEEGRKFAMERHCDVALQRSKWVIAGVISHFDPASIDFLDHKYAPLRGWENVIKALKRDPEFKEMLKHQMIDDALGQLEVAAKLYANNQPKVETK